MRWIRGVRSQARTLLGPFWLGFLTGLGALFAAWVAFFCLLDGVFLLGDPSEQVFRDLLDVDIALFIAFSVATAGASIGTQGLENHITWLGSACSVSSGGVIAIGVCVTAAAYLDADHSGVLPRLLLYWVLSASALLAVFVAFLPYAAFNWRREAEVGG